MIKGVKIIPKKIIRDARGQVMHMLRSDDKEFTSFGEIYFSTVNPRVIKGWHLHKKMTLRYVVVYGKIKLVLFDDRPRSKTRGEIMEIFLGADDYKLVLVPPNIWNGFQGLYKKAPSIVANCSNIPHDPNEIVRIDYQDKMIPYVWK